MRINDILRFNSEIEFDEFKDLIRKQPLSEKDREDIYNHIIKRLTEQYLDPAEKLILEKKETYSFAIATLLSAVIDALGKYIYKDATVAERFKRICTDKLDISKGDSNKLYDNLRCGIVHEAIIKNDTFISMNTDGYLEKTELIKTEDGKSVINLPVLKEKIRSFINKLNEENAEDKNLVVDNFISCNSL